MSESNINNRNEPCGDDNCFCSILEGPITIHIEGGTTFKLETACLKRIKEIGLSEEQLHKVEGVLDFLSKLKISQTKAFTNDEQIQALNDVMNFLDLHKNLGNNLPIKAEETLKDEGR